MPSLSDPALALTPEEAGLLDWSAALTPAQRLAELQSRVEFRLDDDTQLPAPDWRASGSVLDLR